MWSHDKLQLYELIKKDGLQHGEFRLASGNISSFYFDCKRCLLTNKGLRTVSRGFAEFVLETLTASEINSAICNQTHVAGMGIGGVPLVTVLATYWDFFDPIFVRESTKVHGTKHQVEGNYKANDKVLVVDDVLTTGKSLAFIITALREEGLNPVRVFTIVDREIGAKKKIENSFNVEVSSMFMSSDFGQIVSPEKIE